MSAQKKIMNKHVISLRFVVDGSSCTPQKMANVAAQAAADALVSCNAIAFEIESKPLDLNQLTPPETVALLTAMIGSISREVRLLTGHS